MVTKKYHNSNKIEECLPSCLDTRPVNEVYEQGFDEDIVGTTYKYDRLNRLVEEIDVYGNVVRKLEYNEIGKITVETNANGDITHFNYNKASWLISKYEPKIKAENGETLYNGTFYEYNKLGQVVVEKRCSEYLKLNQRPSSYNKMGIVHRVTDSTGTKIFYEVDNTVTEH